MDRLEKGLTDGTRIRVTYAEVTVSAKALEARHLCGPVSAAALAEGLAGVALLSADAGEEDEAWMLRVTASGPIGGMLVEGTGSGYLRGFTNRKILPDLDERQPIDTAPAWGDSGSVQIVSTLPGRVLSQAVLQVNPLQIRLALARYFNQSVQIPTGCCVRVVADDGGVLSARGLLVQKMVDSDTDAFVQLLEEMETDRLGGVLAARVLPDGIAGALAQVPGGGGLRVHERRELSFHCRCSKERVLRVLSTLDEAELQVLIDNHQAQDVTCHMCGQSYRAEEADLQSVLDAARKRDL